jgi:hypothetical protein
MICNYQQSLLVANTYPRMFLIVVLLPQDPSNEIPPKAGKLEVEAEGSGLNSSRLLKNKIQLIKLRIAQYANPNTYNANGGKVPLHLLLLLLRPGEQRRVSRGGGGRSARGQRSGRGRERGSLKEGRGGARRKRGR